MKNFLTLLTILICGAASSFAGTATITLAAGDLTDLHGTALAPNSLLLLVAAGPDGIFDTTLQAGQFYGGDDILLGAQAVNDDLGSIQSTSNLFNFDSGSAGQAVEIVWFPNFTLAQYQASQTPAVGQYYGTFAGITSGPTNGGDAWLVPGANGAYSLSFTTQSANTNLGLGYADAYSNATGEALLQVIAVSVPEPGSYGWGVIALLALVVLVRRTQIGQYRAPAGH